MRRASVVGIFLLLAVLIFAGQQVAPQGSIKDLKVETSISVPELTEFHEVIFKIWHTAWPNKDSEMLTKLLPDVERGSAAVAKAKIPGILREKQVAWKESVDKLETIVRDYRAAVEAKQEQQLLDVAERLHTQYEALVRTIRPPLNELQDFHVTLYKIYHYYMPQNSLDEVKVALGDLQVKMAALNKAVLPQRFKGREGPFAEARNRLDKAVSQLGSTIKSDDSGKIKAAIDEAHACYQALAKILE
jgi:hypothetical protein